MERGERVLTVLVLTILGLLSSAGPLAAAPAAPAPVATAPAATAPAALAPAVHVLQVWEFPRIQDPNDRYDRFSWLRSILSRFEAEHPGVRVRLTELTWRQGEDKLKIAAYAGAPPDVTSGTLPLGFVRQGVVLPVDEYLDEKDLADYLPGALAAFRWGGRIWGFPWCSKTDVLFLNTDLFAERGVPVPSEGRWTRDEFLDAARRLTFDRDGDGALDVYGVGFCLVPGRTSEFGFMLQPGGALLSPDGTSLALAEEPAGVDGLRFLADLAGRYRVAPSSSGGASAKDLWLGFFERQSVAMIPEGLWALKALRAKHPFGFALAHFPDAPSGQPRVLASTAGYYVFRSGNPERERLSALLARFITSAENQRIVRAYGQFPTRRSVGDLYADDPQMLRAAQICAFGEPVPTAQAWARVDEALKRSEQLVALGELTPEAAAAQVAPLARQWLVDDEAAGTAASSSASSSSSSPSSSSLLVLLLFCGACGLAWFFRVPAHVRREEAAAWAFLSPALLLLAVFFAYPVLQALLLGFQDYRVGQGLFENWVGLRNFHRIFQDPVFWTALENTAVYTALTVPANLLTGLVLASCIAPLAARWRHFFRGAYYLPGVTSVVVLAMVWRWLYDVEYGFINRALAALASTWWGNWIYQVVRNLTEAVPAIPRLLVFATALGGLALLARAASLRTVLRRSDTGLARRFGSGPGLLGRAVRSLDAAAGDLGLTAFAALSVGTVALAALAMAAVPFRLYSVEAVGWLTTTKLSLFSIVWSMVIRGPGGALLIYLAALEACPRELYEVAELDGAGPVGRWWHLTLPLLRPTTLFLLVTQTIGSFQVFAQVSLLTDGGPGVSSSVLVHRIYTAAFRDLDFGYASAMALVLFVLIALISGVQFFALGDER